jgi:hypothetical protein
MVPGGDVLYSDPDGEGVCGLSAVRSVAIGSEHHFGTVQQVGRFLSKVAVEPNS